MKKILVIRFDALGDTILTLPFLETLKKSIPDSYVTVIASERGGPALVSCPFVDNLITADRVNSTEMKRLSVSLSKEGYDTAFILTEKIEGYELAKKAKIPLRIGFRPGFSQPFKDLLSRFYCTNTVYYENSPNFTEGLHEVERQFLLLKEAGINAVPERYSMHFKLSTVNLPEFLLKKGSAIVLQLSMKWLEYGWRINFLVKLLEVLLQEFENRALIVTYSDMEESLAKELMQSKLPPKVIYLKGSTFDHWVSVLSKSSLIITMDTSAAHVAAGLNVPCVDIFNEKFYLHTLQRWHPWKSPYYPVKRYPQDKRVTNNPMRSSEEDYVSFCSKESVLMREILDGIRDVLDGMPS